MISIRQLGYQYFYVFSDRLEYINAFAKYRKYDGVATRTRQIRYHHEENSNLGPNKLHTTFHTPKSNLVPRLFRYEVDRTPNRELNGKYYQA